jgi:hypothetical protein
MVGPPETKLTDMPSPVPPNVPALKPVGFLKSLGPGLVTGAADDDPSGIATYSQVGAQFGYGLAWTMLFSFPLMARHPGGQRTDWLRYWLWHRSKPSPSLFPMASARGRVSAARRQCDQSRR